MRVIKRSGSEVEFDITKIIAAVNKANATVSDDKKLTKEQITELAADVEEVCKNIGRAVSVEEIQDMVENHIMAAGAFELARQYITYR